jgi:hypothetical protein
MSTEGDDQTKFSIKHMNYKCPIGKDVNLNVFASNFSELFSSLQNSFTSFSKEVLLEL